MNCVMCRQPTVTPFSTLQKFIVCVCLQEHYQCMKCDVGQKYQCGLCGRITFVIHVDLRFANDDLCVSEMETQSLDQTSNDGSHDEDSASQALWQSETESNLIAMESGRSHSLDSARSSINLPRRRSSSLECTRDRLPGFEPAIELEVDDDRLCHFKRSSRLTTLFRRENYLPYLACCSTKMFEPKQRTQEPKVADLDSYAAEEMRLLMGCPYSVRRPVDLETREMESNKDIRLYTKEERRARLDYINKEYKYAHLQQKYLLFGCQFLTKRRHMEWLTSEPKYESPDYGIPLVRRVLYPCSSASEPHSESIELPDDFNESPLFSVSLPFPFMRLEKSQFLANCPKPSCQEALYKYNITFHLTLQHNAWIVKYLPLKKPFSFELDLKVTRWNVNCHAVIQLQNVLFEYSRPGVELSLTIMSRHVQLSEILGTCESDQRLTFIWAATTIANCFPLKVNLTLWPKAGKSTGSTISYTGSAYDIKRSIRPFDLIKSGRVIMLTANQVDALTQKGKEKVGIQFVAMMGPYKTLQN
ncbi:uncharacterized protein LOC6551364 [Drosophila erecta]|uniref:Uncharacterized protein n=1 Tax=Drosophila erecta TaxID=7220 RepID=A0A0Q5T5H1_DROER|nr:uncharacterized protein LOC6551364 [Drosophila erecta]KQS30445.1 uncharacterized protein Dere_GG19554 [Drosophila erecta]